MRRVGHYLQMLGYVIAIWQASLVLGQGAPSIWYEDLGTARRVAAETNRLLLVHFWAEWCRPCRQMEAEVFSRPDVLSALATNYVAVKVNYDRAPNLVREFRIESIPADVILTPDGQVLQRFVGGSPAERYIDRINQIAYSYKQRSMALARTTTPPAGPPPGGYSGMPWAQAAQTPAPGYEPPSPGMGTNRVSAPFGVTAGTRDYQSDYINRQAPAIAPGTPAYGQMAVAPSVSAPPQNAIMPQLPGENTRPSNYGTNPAIGRGASDLAAGSPPPTPADANRMAARGPLAPQSPTTNLAPAGSPWDTPRLSDARAPSSPSSGMTQPSPPASLATTMSSRPSSKPKVEIPPGNPPLALEGYCPVSLTDKQRWVLGNPRWGARHEGRTYLFAGPEEQQKFLANPDRYAPVLSGLDVVQLVEATQMSDGRREFGAWFGGRVYLFSSEESYQKFSSDPYRYINGLPQAIARLSQQIQGGASLTGPQQTLVRQNPAGQALNPAASGLSPAGGPISAPVGPRENPLTGQPAESVERTSDTTSASWTPPPTVNIQLPPSVQAAANGVATPERPRWPVAQRPRW